MATLMTTRHTSKRYNQFQLDVTFVRMIGGFDRSVVVMIKSIDPKYRSYDRRRRLWEIDTQEWRRIAAQLKWIGHTIIERECVEHDFDHEHGGEVAER